MVELALLLTYIAVSLAAVPIALSAHHASGPLTAQVGVLVMIGLASPFLEMADPIHGIIGLIILLVGLQIAWKITAARKLDIVGPVSEPAAAATPG